MTDPAAASCPVLSTRARLEQAQTKVESQLSQMGQIDRRFMTARVLSFSLIVLGYFLTAFREDERFAWFMMIPALLGFVLVVRIHRPRRVVMARSRRLESIIAAKLKRLDSEQRPLPPGDLANICEQISLEDDSPEHQSLAPYVLDDLGVMKGRSHLFGLLWTGFTRLGTIQLGKWLKNPSLSFEEVKDRNEAAQELAAALSLRNNIEQDFATVGSQLGDADLLCLINDPFHIPAQERTQINGLGTAVTLSLILGAFIFSSTICFALVFVSAAAMNYLNRDSLEDVPRYRGFMSGIKPTLRAIAVIEERLRHFDPKSKRLGEIASRLRAATHHEEMPIHAVESRLRLLNIYKFGLLYVVVSWLTLFDLHVLPGVLAGFKKHRQIYKSAFAALGELEALMSLATIVEEQNGWHWPTLSNEDSSITIEEGIHPLLPWNEAQSNSIQITQEAGVLVITGSNMSGKSTFLKMCGLNQLLAQCGGPVRAKSMITAPHLLHTDINVSDSLDDGRSYFAVEVGRIKDVLDDLEKSTPTFSLLDEMFRGTNTNEKVAAGIEVTKWIAKHDGKALVATHDQPFTKLAKDKDYGIRNFHFTEEIKDGTMIFDYRLREGHAQSSNAIRVLGLEGYPTELVQNAMESSQNHD